MDQQTQATQETISRLGAETGADFILEPATDADMRGKNAAPKESLEVIYDDA